MSYCRVFYLCILAVFGVVVGQLGLGGMYGNPYGMGMGMGGMGDFDFIQLLLVHLSFAGIPGMGLGYGGMMGNPYGSYDYSLLGLGGGGYGYNPMFSGMLGKK
ncbi:unnamed protein product [Strongylus vulgaris]|uniref:Uncharacterized protein n=1 Tax=Strongylus vulgaris TaxID=40348 RepID=A0A3P7IAM0_STRVU|nr:unnamed protein product [Strongylus vulgaris]